MTPRKEKTTANSRQALRFWAMSMAISLAVIAGFLTVASQWLDMGLTGLVALGLGIGFSVAIGTGLMTLIFYSDNSGQDDLAGGQQ
jgi:hypothetical protein